jgi:hypothetical protein
MPIARVLSLCGLAALLAGCTGGAGQDAAPIYEAVLQEAFPGKDRDDAIFLFIDGKDPPAALLKTLRGQMPKLEGGSQAPQGKATRIDLSDLTTEGDSAELRGTVSNGIDGTVQRFWLIRKNNFWVIEKSKVEAES